MTSFSRPDPLDPPMVQVLVDGTWWPGFVRAQEQRDGGWWITVQYAVEGRNHLAGFPEDQVRPDETDYSRGRSVGGGT
jgi:hypothetical protein